MCFEEQKPKYKISMTNKIVFTITTCHIKYYLRFYLFIVTYKHDESHIFVIK